MLPSVNHFEVAVFSKNLLTADEIAGVAMINLSPGTRLHRKLADFQTHDVYIELEQQGRLLLRMTMVGEQEDVDFWFRKSNERLIRVRNDFIRKLTTQITPHVKNVIFKLVKNHEAAPTASKSFFSSLTNTIELSNLTSNGDSINEPVSAVEAERDMDPFIEYLDKNLETLCSSLTSKMAQEVIQRTWNECLLIISSILLPPLYGTIDPLRKSMNIRQLDMLSRVQSGLYLFFHADGEGLGLAVSFLKSAQYDQNVYIFSRYNMAMDTLTKEYTVQFRDGADTEGLLRLIRMFVNCTDIGASNPAYAQWLENSLDERKESGRRSAIAKS